MPGAACEEELFSPLAKGSRMGAAMGVFLVVKMAPGVLAYLLSPENIEKMYAIKNVRL